MTFIKRNQKGITFVELLIVLPIIGIIVAAASGVTIQLIQSNATSAHMSALRQVQTAGYWVSRDSLQAQSVVTEASSGFPLTLSWGSGAHEVEYSLKNMASGDLKYLERKEILNGDVGNPIITMVGQYNDSDNDKD